MQRRLLYYDGCIKNRKVVSGKSAVYTVTGYIQSVNHAGKVCQLTSEGYEAPGGKIDTLNVYLNDKEAEAFTKSRYIPF